jgi:hypothetical protein
MIRLRGVEGLALLDARLPLARFLSGLALVAARVGEQQDHAGIDAGRQPIGSPALVVAAEQTARTAGQIGHVPRWSRIRSRPVRSRSQHFWSARDTRIAGRDLQSNRAGRNRLS